MLMTRCTRPDFRPPDKDLILRWSSTGNHLVLNRPVDRAVGLLWGTTAPGPLIIEDPTVSEPASVLFGSRIVRGYKQWDDLDVGNATVDARSSALFEAALSASWLMGNINTPHIQARLRTLVRSHFEVRTQASIQEEVEEIKGWYVEKVSQIPEVEKIRCKHTEKSIEFIVAVDRIRRRISQQLSRIEFQLYNQYTDWFFEFEHIGVRTFSQWSLRGYDNLFDRK